MAENLWQPILTRWLDQGTQPYLNITWWVSHPLVMVVAIVGLLVIAQGVLGLVSKVIKQLLLLIVKSPFLLLQWLLAKSSKSLNLPTLAIQAPKFIRKSGPENNHKERLNIVLNQLETAQKEQDRLLKELRHLLAESKKQAIQKESGSSSSSQPPAN